MQALDLNDKMSVNCDDKEMAVATISAFTNRTANCHALVTQEVLETSNDFSSCRNQFADEGIKCTAESQIAPLVTQTKSDDSNPRVSSRIEGGVLDIADGGCELPSCTPSKIPVLTSNLRQAKCASWSGVVDTTAAAAAATVESQGTQILHEMQTPAVDPSRTHHYSYALQNSPNIMDLTPGLSCLCFSRLP